MMFGKKIIRGTTLIGPKVISFCAAMPACEKSGQWLGATPLVYDAQGGLDVLRDQLQYGVRWTWRMKSLAGGGL